MSWSLKRPNTALRIARFLPEVTPAHEPKPIAGLTPEARAAHRAKREVECRKVEFKVIQPSTPL